MNFLSIIKREFSKYKWKRDYQIDYEVNDNHINVCFPACTIFFFHNFMYGAIECEIGNPLSQNERYYSLSEVLKYNDLPSGAFDKDIFDLAPSDQKVTMYAERIVGILFEKLKHVIRGDFSWVKKAQEFDRNRKAIQDALDTPFVGDHPIYKKLERNDPGWRDDLKRLKE